MYEIILRMILEKKFDCVEDAIDFIVKAYKAGSITLYERNELINII